MRPIKFRAKAVEEMDTSTDHVEIGDWVEGYYLFSLHSAHVMVIQMNAESGGVGSGIVEAQIQIDINTLGQYINRKDKNKVELCEGDILRTKSGWIGYIVYMNAGYILVQHEEENGEMMTRPEWDKCEKIGTKFDKPELLEDYNEQRR